MKLIRVFPRKTNASPTDENARFGPPAMWDEADKVHVSVAFDYDRTRAERLAKEWQYVTPNVKIGGPAYDDRGGDFTPGLYLRRGYTITSRGCPNRCWFCEAWKNEGNDIRELPIRDGYNILDNNLLACSDDHVKAVFAMLARQKERPMFTGGLEAMRLREWHVTELAKLKPSCMWFAYDTPDDWDPLVGAANLLKRADMLERSNATGCYVLIGYGGDTLRAAESRLVATARLGFFPQAMLIDNGTRLTKCDMRDWRKLRREWCNRVITGVKVKEARA